MDDNIANLGKQGIAADMTVVEFLVGMALTRGGAMSPRDLAHAVSAWLGKGIEALRGFYAAMVRMLDAGRRLLDVAVFLSLIKEFERNGS